YWYIYIAVLGFELPKTAHLRQVNDGWSAKVDIIDRNIEHYDQVLSTLQTRDDDVYRSLFGMSPIPEEVRNAGFGGVNRYSYLDDSDYSSRMKGTMLRLDVLTKKSYVQSKSYDEISTLAKKVDEMASCIPNISPIVPDKNLYHLSSGYGVRSDPFTGRATAHSGMDFSLPYGTPIYATGDGKVVAIEYSRAGYGNQVLIDHGFGYKTRYGHLSTIFVQEGDEVKRGDFIGKAGNTGRSTGPHLHYEVIYMDRTVNPINYVDLDISVAEYKSMLRHVEAESGFSMHPSHSK
ncbi:MAG: M23 family metallopeptidase, partial [Bacteroidales bacterium]|nr:M23 family metallopeptidase [Bacteroidales bacterium]